MNINDIAFVDIETTGGRAESDRIIEIGIICVKNNEVCEEFSTLINPEMPFSPFIEMITGIKQADVVDAPTFDQVQGKIYELLKDKLFIAHNVGFDYGFIKQEFKRLGLSFHADRCCTVKLSRHFYPQHRRHNLDSLIERHNFSCESRHRAFSDTSVLWQFYQHLCSTYTFDTVAEAMQIVSKRPALPTHIDKSMVDSIPESPGVYIFYGEEGIPLYIGKSKNLKDRVWSHFTLASESAKERDIAQQLRKIETIESAGEFSALLLEARLVKEMKPIYNRKLRRCDDLLYIVKSVNADGYIIPHIKSSLSEYEFSIHDILAVHKTRTQAKRHLESILEEHSLCRVLLGFEKSKTGCFNHKLGKCHGACVGKEHSALYNARFALAFAKTSVKSWPYKDAIVIDEVDVEKRAGEKHIFQNWQYKGTVKYNQETTAFEPVKDEKFDYDKYMILKSYLHSHPYVKSLTMNELSMLQEGYIQ